MKIINTVDLIKSLHTTSTNLNLAKNKLGYRKGERVYTKDIYKLKAEINKIPKKSGGNPNKDYPGYYKIASKILEEKGFITKRELLKIFHTTKPLTVLGHFEKNGNSIYDERIPITKEEKRLYHNFSKTMIIYKPLNRLYAQWRAEKKINGLYNNSYQGNRGVLF